jgi:CRP-like cAMP-binding protein
MIDAARLRPSALFEGLSDEDLEQCAGRFEEMELLSGSGIAKEGDFSYKFFVVLEGEVDVLRDFDLVARLGAGDFFGEMGASADQPRNARVVAHTRCDLAVMMAWDFKTMLKEFPDVANRIDAKVAERMASVSDSET